MIKVAFLHEVVSKKDDWGTEHLKARAISIFQYIADCCQKGEMIHPLLNDVNVLEDLKSKRMSGIPLLMLAEDSAGAIVNKLNNDAVPSKTGLIEPDFHKYSQVLSIEIYMNEAAIYDYYKNVISSGHYDRFRIVWDWIKASTIQNM